MGIEELRNEISLIDQEFVALFVKRMHVAAKIAEYKQENQLPIHDPAREKIVLDMVIEQAGPEMSDYVLALYTTLIELSRNYQNQLI